VSTVRVVKTRRASSLVEDQVSENVIQRKRSERLASLPPLRIVQPELPTGGKHLDQLPPAGHGKAHQTLRRRRTAERNSEIGMQA